ncbi:3'-5' RNA exonuclease complex component [Coemansia sp. RSA 2603]|nr:3'-5' RNA exonuclease complex component [Coemansia sp. RSA 2603]
MRNGNDNGNRKDNTKYPSLDDILGSPATTFSQLITQLETLIKHPSPPRNYADALAKDELRRTDYRDLTPEITPDDMSEKRKAPLRQRPRLLRNGQRVIEQTSNSAAEDDSDDRPLSEAMAANLGITPEQQERRRIWMSKIKGYTAFRQNLVSMDTLVNSIDTRDGPEDAENDAMLAEGRQSISQMQAQIDKEDEEFERLIRRSWRIYDEDLADFDRAEGKGGSAAGGKTPGGSRSVHTWAQGSVRQMHTSSSTRTSNSGAGGADPGDDSGKGKPAFSRRSIRVVKQAKRLTSREQKMSQSRQVRETRMTGRSMIRAADVPSREKIRKHVVLDKDEVHIPIGASVHTGDIVEIRASTTISQSSPFSVALYLGGVLQKVTGRFHFNVINVSNVLAGGRENRVGFVAPGALFDRELLESSGVAAADVDRIMAHGQQLQEHVAQHGEEGLANAADAQLLYEANRAAQLAQIAARSAGGSGSVDRAPVQEIEDSDALGVPRLPVAESTSAVEENAEGSDTEPIALVMMRVFPQALRLLHQKADQLRRSRFQELEAHWALATAHHAHHVTVDGLAALMFGSTGTVERLAAYMQLIGDPLHYVPDAEYLFVTGRFALRPRKEVEEYERTLAMVRSGAPEFTEFITRAQRLVAYAQAREPSAPHNSAIDPDLATYQRTHRCALTGWQSNNEAFRRRPPATEPLTHSEVNKIRFSATDMLFIEAVRRFVFESGHEYTTYNTPYSVLAPYIIKKMRMYQGCSVTTATAFLRDIGVWPQTFTPANHAPSHPYRRLSGAPNVCERRSMADVMLRAHLHKVENPDAPLPSFARYLPSHVPDYIAPPVASSVLTRKTDAVGSSSAAAGVMDKTDLYAHDVCRDIRHDFGDLPVYTIDDAATRDVDDGLSIEHVRDASGALRTWIHVHVADPTALVPPGHVAAASALQQATTMYFVEHTQHMFPAAVIERLMGLTQRPDGRPTEALTFSFVLDDQGDIADYQVRASLVRNIRAVPYDVAVRHLSFENQLTGIRSLEQMQSIARNATLIHPFAPADEQRPLYAAAPVSPLPASVVADLQALQREAQRHTDLRVRDGTFSSFFSDGSVAIEADRLPRVVNNPRAPKYLEEEHSAARWPRIIAIKTPSDNDPAHALVAELMILAGRVAARFASERGVPLLYRTQAPPNLAALNGVQPDMPLAFEELTMEQAQSAAVVYDAMLARARANNGCLDIKIFDEVRHMLNPSYLTTQPGGHSGLGIPNAPGYARVTSPMRRAEDLVCHWQIKAQLLAEHADSRDRAPWYWSHADLELLASKLYLRSYLADKITNANADFWRYSLIRRMESDARHGRLALPPAGFYHTDCESFLDTPWAYYNPASPGPLVWTAYMDNRDASRPFISLTLGIIAVRAALPMRPIDPAHLPFAGTKIRVETVSVDPVTRMMVVKLAPEHLQPPETPQFWRQPIALTNFAMRHISSEMPPAVMPQEE